MRRCGSSTGHTKNAKTIKIGVWLPFGRHGRVGEDQPDGVRELRAYAVSCGGYVTGDSGANIVAQHDCAKKKSKQRAHRAIIPNSDANLACPSTPALAHGAGPAAHRPDKHRLAMWAFFI
jgi:hypothetical protein